MSNRVKYAVLTVAAAVALVLVIADFVVAQTNRSAQIEINGRQQFINQSIELGRVNQTLVRAIAVAAVRDKDSRLGAILAEQGITVHENPAPAPAPAATTPAASGKPAKDHK